MVVAQMFSSAKIRVSLNFNVLRIHVCRTASRKVVTLLRRRHPYWPCPLDTFITPHEVAKAKSKMEEEEAVAAEAAEEMVAPAAQDGVYQVEAIIDDRYVYYHRLLSHPPPVRPPASLSKLEHTPYCNSSPTAPHTISVRFYAVHDSHQAARRRSRRRVRVFD